jgi:exonuclease III
VHIYYGTAKANDLKRVREITAIATLLAQRNTKRQSTADGEPENVILIGDFNIFNRSGDKTSKALQDNDFVVPFSLRKRAGSNLGQDKYFDQIAFHDPSKRLRTSSRAGVFNFTPTIYGDGEGEAKAHTKAMERSTAAQSIWANKSLACARA